ncbi:MAG: hypothetical protein LC746_03550 [Acidobacteria bacterium]|nr:hypothetical protein [Acidobacteriota bacterium]
MHNATPAAPNAMHTHTGNAAHAGAAQPAGHRQAHRDRVRRIRARLRRSQQQRHPQKVSRDK